MNTRQGKPNRPEPPDPEAARPHFLRGVIRVVDGLVLQRSRILTWSAEAPEILPGVVDLRDTPSHDLDYYVFELARLQDIARDVAKIFQSERSPPPSRSSTPRFPIFDDAETP